MEKTMNTTFDTQAEHIDRLKPNSALIRRKYLFICLSFALGVMLLEIVMFAVLFSQRDETLLANPVLSVISFFVVPTAVNFSAVLCAWMIHKKCGNHEMLQNGASIMALVALCTVVASMHYIFSVTLAIFCLPIFMSCVFGSRKLNTITCIVSFGGITIATVFRLIFNIDEIQQFLLMEIFASYSILATASIMSKALINMIKSQHEKLLNATRDAEQSKKEALLANQAKSDFLANMSHEIRTPLNAIIGLTEMIERKSTEKEIREYAADIQSSGNGLLAIINDILDISKIESGKMEIHESNYELGSLINDSYNMVAVRCRQKGLKATVTCDANLPRMLRGDEYHLRQIIVNLLTNAVKYTNEGGIELNVLGENNGDILRLEVKVKDTGIGIKQEDMDKLFGKFNRLEVNKNRKIEGSGLGLAITKQLVELMNGTIEVESVYGVGSTFTVRVPQKIVDRTPIGDVRTSYMNIHGELSSYKQSFEAPEAKILVVDDVSINLTVIAKLLEATKIQIDTAQSGAECLIKVCETKYDIILMDHMMPQMDGIQTLHAMKNLPSNLNRTTPVIMLTANAMLGVRDSYLNEGFADYLSKPVRGIKLEEMILKYLPKEKVSAFVSSSTTTAKDETITFADLGSLLPELDKQSGLMFCANDESFYISMLKEFAFGKRHENLENAFKNQDWHQYQIEAHSLKSASKMIGLPRLSNECFELEQAAKIGNVEFILQHHASVMEHHRQIVTVLQKLG